MPRLTNSNPSYRKHRASGQAVVTLDGRDIYLGLYGSKASKAQYDRVIGEWLANGRSRPGTAGPDLTVAEVAARFWRHASTYYVKPDGTPSDEQGNFKSALRPLVRLYGDTQASAFGPLALECVRNAMVELGWCRNNVNAQVGRVRMIFKWAVSKELIPASVYQGIVTLSGLRAGRTTARESEPVKPVPMETVQQTLPFLSRTVAAMVQLQLATGARPGEITIMRTADIDLSGAVWTYTPTAHKTQSYGHKRTIHIGKRGQEVLTPFLKLANPDAYCFSPSEAEAERREARHANRKTPINCGNSIGTNVKRQPKRVPQERYTVASYRRAISNGCMLAFMPPQPLGRADGESIRSWLARLTPEQKIELQKWHGQHGWHPHQLRHTAATAIRRQFGIEAAQTVLGHSSLSVTEVYAERDNESARAVALAVG